MFEQVIDKEKKHLGSLLKKDSGKLQLESILSSDLSEAYKTYFQAEVKWWVYQDRVIRNSGSYFNITDEINQVFDKLDKLYFENAVFTKPVLNKVIDSAVKVRLNMLCRPRTAMKWFVFRGEPTRTAKEIECRLDYLNDHSYLISATKQWLNEMEYDKNHGISSAEFEQAIAELDANHFMDMGPKEFYDILVPIFDFFIVSGADKIPIEALIIFSDDKSLGKLTKTLEKMLFRDKITGITKQELVNIITDLFDIKDAETKPAINTKKAPDFMSFEAPKNLGGPVESPKEELKKQVKDEEKSNKQELSVTIQNALKHKEAGTEEAAEEVIHELEDEEHDLEALADLVLQDESIFTQRLERKKYKAITDDDLEDDDDDLSDVLSNLEDSWGIADTEIKVDTKNLETESDIQNELSGLIAELDQESELDDISFDNIEKNEEPEDNLNFAVEEVSDKSEISGFDIENELADLEHDPDWEEVADTYQSEESNSDTVYIPSAEEGLSEETVEKMHEIDNFIISHTEDYASTSPYIEADNLETDVLLDEIEGRHLITKQNDEEEEEIL